jgi:TusA-related sulfurtransferase
MSSLSLQDLLRIEKLLNKLEPNSGLKLLINLINELDKSHPNTWVQKYISSSSLWDSKTSFFKEAKQNLSLEPIENCSNLDLSGVECPTNLAKAVNFLKKNSTAQHSTIILDSGSPIENVPRGLKERGYTVSSRTKISSSAWQISVTKI